MSVQRVEVKRVGSHNSVNTCVRALDRDPDALAVFPPAPIGSMVSPTCRRVVVVGSVASMCSILLLTFFLVPHGRFSLQPTPKTRPKPKPRMEPACEFRLRGQYAFPNKTIQSVEVVSSTTPAEWGVTDSWRHRVPTLSNEKAAYRCARCSGECCCS